MKRAIILAASLLALAACEEKKADPTNDPKTEEPAAKNTTTNATAAAPTGPAQVPLAVTVDEADLATPADFEEMAETSITKANYKTELSTLEADIAKE